jgi:hypothetical protein
MLKAQASLAAGGAAVAERPFPLWAREMSSGGPRPTIGGLLSPALAVLLAVSRA